MAKYVTREGPMATASVWTNLTTCGALGTVNQVVVDAGFGAIKEIWVAAGPDGASADASGAVFALRLEGSGIKYGPVDIPVGAFSSEQTGNNALAELVYSKVIPVDIALNPGGSIWVKGSSGSQDLGTPEMSVTLCMTSGGASIKRYDLRHLTLGAAAANTKVQLTSKVDDTSANQMRVPGDVNKITKFFFAQGGIALATATGGNVFVRLEGDGLIDGPLVFPCGGAAFLSNTTGVDGSLTQVNWLPTDIKVRPGGLIYCYGEYTGTDFGNPHASVGIEFSG